MPEEQQEPAGQAEHAEHAAPAVRLADLPLISVLDKKQFERAKKLFSDLESINEVQATLDTQEKEIQKELDEMQTSNSLEGLRWGTVVYRLQEIAGRSSLDKAKLRVELLKLKVKAEDVGRAILAATKTGKPSLRHTFEDLSKPKKKREGDEAGEKEQQ